MDFKEKRSLIKTAVCVVSTVAVLVLLLVGLSFFLRPVLTHGHSMEPTLSNGDWSLARVFRYTPEHGDVVVIADNHKADKYIVKRVIGLPGDTIEIDFEAGIVYRNGQPLEEPYTEGPTYTRGDVKFPLTVQENTVFVMGDNRNNSTDSRTSYVGLVPTERLRGKVILTVYPFEKAGIVE